MNALSWIGVVIIGVIAATLVVASSMKVAGSLVGAKWPVLTVPIFAILWLFGQPVERYLRGIHKMRQENRFVWNEFFESFFICVILVFIPLMLWMFSSDVASKSYRIQQEFALHTTLAAFGILTGIAIITQGIWMIHSKTHPNPDKKEFLWDELARIWKIK